VTYYRGGKVPLSEKTARTYSLNAGWRNRRSGEGEKKTIGGWFKRKEKPRTSPELQVRTFYRPGRTTFEGTPSYSPKKKAWVPSLPAMGGMKWLFRAAGFLLLVATVAWSRQKTTALLQDVSGMRLAKVSVEGNHYLTAEDITQAAGLPVGENMFKLDLKEAEDKIEKLDWTNRVFIERRLPSSILISVRERKPMALLDNGALYGVDREGRVLPPAVALAGEDLPLISGLPVKADAVGTTAMAESLDPALDFFQFLRKKDPVLAADVSEVNLSEPGALKVTFIDGIQATFAPPVTEAELRRMALVLSDLNGKGKRAGTMDFRYNDMVLVKTR